MADAPCGAAAPILPAALADGFAPQPTTHGPALNRRLEQLAIDAEALRALVSICVEAFVDSGLPPQDFYRCRTLTLLSLAEKLAEQLTNSATAINRAGLAGVGANAQGGAA